MLFHVRVTDGQQLVVLTDQRIMIVSAAAEVDGLPPESIRMAGTTDSFLGAALTDWRLAVGMRPDISGFNQAPCGTIVEVQHKSKLSIVRRLPRFGGACCVA